MVAQTLKGSGGDLIICEEAAYMDQQVFYEVVVPLLGMRDTALIAISTILDPSNFYSKLVDLRDGQGTPLFDVQKFELVCDACRLTKTPWRCTHMVDTMPPWLSESKHLKIRQFLPEELVGRETMGLAMSSGTRAFEATIVETFESSARETLPVGAGLPRALARLNRTRGPAVPRAAEAPAHVIYCAVDPNGGGVSEYAIASILCHSGSTVIIGLDAAPLKNWRDQRDLLLAHLRALRAHPTLQNIPIVLVVESNLGFEAAHNARYVAEANVPHVEVAQEQRRTQNEPETLAEHARAVVGVRTTNESKEQMYILLRNLLEEDTLRVWDELITTHSAGPDKQLSKVIQQMHNYNAVFTDPGRVFAQTRRVFSGKAQGEQDDLLIALQLAILYRRVFIRNCSRAA